MSCRNIYAFVFIQWSTNWRHIPFVSFHKRSILLTCFLSVFFAIVESNKSKFISTYWSIQKREEKIIQFSAIPSSQSKYEQMLQIIRSKMNDSRQAVGFIFIFYLFNKMKIKNFFFLCLPHTHTLNTANGMQISFDSSDKFGRLNSE